MTQAQVNARIAIEKQIVERVAKDAIAAGYSVSVIDGEEVTVRESRDLAAIMAATMTTDEDGFILHDADGSRLGRISFVYGNDGFDVISDHSAILTPFLRGANAFAATFEK